MSKLRTSFRTISNIGSLEFIILSSSCRLIEVSSDSEDDDPNNVVKGKHDLMVKSSSQKQQSGFFKSSKKRFPMFPYYEEKSKYDDYGEVIKLVL